MLYAIIGQDIQNSLARRLEARPAHVARLADLEQQGRLELAGPFPLVGEDSAAVGFSGSLIVAEFASIEAARAWAEADPYVVGGVYARVEVSPFKKVFPSK